MLEIIYTVTDSENNKRDVVITDSDLCMMAEEKAKQLGIEPFQGRAFSHYSPAFKSVKAEY